MKCFPTLAFCCTWNEQKVYNEDNLKWRVELIESMKNCNFLITIYPLKDSLKADLKVEASDFKNLQMHLSRIHTLDQSKHLTINQISATLFLFNLQP